MNNKLLLGSSSPSRQRLLREAQIPFVVVGHNLDEASCEFDDFSFQKMVEQIALAKMEHVNLPMDVNDGDVCFVLTADTLCLNSKGKILGKPKNKSDAIENLKSSRGGAKMGSAFCLDKRTYKFNRWVLERRIKRFVQTDYIFSVPDEWIDKYLEKSLCLVVSGAIAIEDFGGQFLKKVDGSYSAIIGLPMFELREALCDIGFFN